MTQAELKMTVRRLNDTTSVVDIQGDVTGAAENMLTDAYTQASTGGSRAIILNFAKLEYMNSSGIGLLVMLLIRANRQKQSVLAVELSEHYQQIFDLTRLNESIRIYKDEGEALAALESAAS